MAIPEMPALRRSSALLAAALVLAAATAPASADPTTFGRFGAVAIHRPNGAPTAVLLMLSGDAGWGAAEDNLARTLAAGGTLVGGIDSARLRHVLAHSGETCAYPAADLELFAHWLQARERLPGYLPPVLAGLGGGGALAYALLAQSPSGTYAGGLSLGFCPSIAPIAPLCPANALRVQRARDGASRPAAVPLRDPWVLLVGEADATCPPSAAQAFVSGLPNARVGILHGRGPADTPDSGWAAAALAATHALARRESATALAAASGPLTDLPLIEVPVAGSGELLAILITGDGGWAGLDQALAAALAARAVPVVALNSLKYFWTARTPQRTADDLARVATHYLHAWDRRRLLLVGYSQGADVLPFAINRLDPALRERIAGAALLGPGERASFEFHLSHWLADPDGGLPLAEELGRLTDVSVACIRGSDESESPCIGTRGKVHEVVLAGGHHFNDDYAAVAREVLAAADRR